MQCTNINNQFCFKNHFEYFDQFFDKIVYEFAKRCLPDKLDNVMINCFIDSDIDNREVVLVGVPIEEAKRYFLEIKREQIQKDNHNHGSIFLPHPPKADNEEESDSDGQIIEDFRNSNNDAQIFPNYQDIEYFSEYSNEEEEVGIGDQRYHIIDIQPKKSKKPKSQEEIARKMKISEMIKK
ncbi:hypothetical protein M9Y10_044667 [Tritrichomonas musculus]|uniref:Uncharacterized protein n=1 Tax=Tritrichomonas musculus TaxID=1915356 RepID=A0ABR2JTS8_9EUKA